MASEPIPTALVAFRVPSDPCLTGRGKSAGLLPEPLRCTSDANMDLVPACTDSDGDANLIGVLVLAQTGLQRNKNWTGIAIAAPAGALFFAPAHACMGICHCASDTSRLKAWHWVA